MEARMIILTPWSTTNKFLPSKMSCTVDPTVQSIRRVPKPGSHDYNGVPVGWSIWMSQQWALHMWADGVAPVRVIWGVSIYMYVYMRERERDLPLEFNSHRLTVRDNMWGPPMTYHKSELSTHTRPKPMGLQPFKWTGLLDWVSNCFFNAGHYTCGPQIKGLKA